MTDPAFEECVFINCPFDADYDAMLQAILFCIVYLGFTPRIAKERNDSGEYRLDKIKSLIEGSKYSIHDLSRIQASEKGEYYRLNMPFELGIDYGCRQYYGKNRDQKKILILEEKKFRYQTAISDLAGCDIEAHNGEVDVAIRKIRNWLMGAAGIPQADGASSIYIAYTTKFQQWYFRRQKSAGFSDADITDYQTSELLAAMKEWVAIGKPV